MIRKDFFWLENISNFLFVHQCPDWNLSLPQCLPNFLLHTLHETSCPKNFLSYIIIYICPVFLLKHQISEVHELYLKIFMFPTGSRKESPFINVHSIEIKSILSHIIYISFILRTWAPWSYPHSINWHWKYTNEERVLLRLRHHLLPLRTRCWREKHQCYSDLWAVWEEEGGWNKNTRPWPTGAQVRPQASWKA